MKNNEINEFIKDQAVRAIDVFQENVHGDEVEGPTKDYKVVFNIFGKPVRSREGKYSFDIKMTDNTLNNQNVFYKLKGGIVYNPEIDGITYWEFMVIGLVESIFNVSHEDAKKLVTDANLLVQIKKI